MITLSGIGEKLLATVIFNMVSYIFTNIRYLNLKFYKPNNHIRIAFTTILRVFVSGHYILVRNLHRKETFAPFGGVIKYYENAKSDLDKLDFRPHIIEPLKDIELDLRGYLPRKNLLKLLKWYDKKIDRELYSDCLNRELKEEINESKHQKILICPTKINYRFVRKVIEKPKYIETQGCYQFRIFEVYDIYPKDRKANQLMNKMFELSKTSKNLIAVIAEEIKIGRSKCGKIIGPHTHYLLNHRRNRPDDPIFVNPKK